MTNKIDDKLRDVLQWANKTLAEGKEPPWSWYQFMKLREAIEAIRSSSINIPIQENATKRRPVYTGNIVQMDIPAPMPLEDRIQRELIYMAKTPACKFIGLIDKDYYELDEELRAMIDRGYVIRDSDGFHLTEKGLEAAK